MKTFQTCFLSGIFSFCLQTAVIASVSGEEDSKSYGRHLASKRPTFTQETLRQNHDLSNQMYSYGGELDENDEKLNINRLRQVFPGLWNNDSISDNERIVAAKKFIRAQEKLSYYEDLDRQLRETVPLQPGNPARTANQKYLEDEILRPYEEADQELIALQKGEVQQGL